MVLSFNKLKEVISKEKKNGKKVGYITGCFDILHIGHIKLFREAKKRVDILVVGLDSDMSIQLSKGKDRPVNPIEIRLEQIDELKSVDYVFEIKDVIDFGSSKAQDIHFKYTSNLMPNILFTSKRYDMYWKEKKQIAKELGIKVVDIKDSVRITSTTKVIERLIRE